MNSHTKQQLKMMPFSGRIPEDLYQWLSTTSFAGATTMSDKLRVAVSTLKQLQDGDTDYNGALGMHRDLCEGLRQQLIKLETVHGHSEVLAAVLEHAPAISAALTSAQIDSVKDAQQLEDILVQRCLRLAESLLRQAVTRQARAYDQQVVARHAPPLIELANIIHQQPTDTSTKKRN